MAQGNAHSTILNGKDRLHNLMLNTIVISHTHTREKKNTKENISNYQRWYCILVVSFFLWPYLYFTIFYDVLS